MRRNAAILLGLTLLGAVLYAQTRHFEFVNYDDPQYIRLRPELREGLSWPGVRWAFTTSFGNYIPITELSYLADYSMHGLDPGGYHLTNAALHTANALLLFLFLVRTTGAPWCSAIVAALFLVHPLRAESVAWISSRKDLTCGFFWMLTLHAYASYARRPRFTWYLLVFAGVCLALLSKPMAVTLPFVLLLLDVWPFARIRRGESGTAVARLVAEKLPLLVPVAASSIVTLAIQQSAGAVSSADRLPISDRVGNAIHAYGAYIANTIAPRNLIPIYPFDSDTAALASPVNLAILAAGLAVSFAALRFARRAGWFATGWFWYAGTLVPVIGLVQVGAQSMADRYTYLPQIGLLVAVVWGARAMAERAQWARTIAATAAIAAIAGGAALSYRQAKYWHDSVTLWTYTLDVSPENAVAHSLLGEAYLQRGERLLARAHLDQAVRIQPGHRPALLNLAKLDVQEDNYESALAICRQLIAVRADDPEAHVTWSSILMRRGAPKEALDHVDTALGADPNHPEALINRAAALLLLGRPQEALEPALKSIRRAPDDAVAFVNLAAASLAVGRVEDARRYCDEALRLDPKNRSARLLRQDINVLGPA